MVRKKATPNERAKKRVKHEHDREPFNFMKLPTELRLEVYRVAVVKKGEATYTLQPPALAQVCRQIRTEILPIYYGENDFHIQMDIDVIIFKKRVYPVRKDDDTELVAFLKKCAAIVSTGGLKYVKSLSFNYSEPVFGDMYNYLFGFDLSSDNARRHDYYGRDTRIGDDNLEWKDYEAVNKAFNITIDRAVGSDADDLRLHVPVKAVIDVALEVVKHCHAANRLVTLSWDYGH